MLCGNTGASLSGLRILVVEGEESAARNTRRALAALGAEVLGAVPTCEEALAILSRFDDVDAAILGITLRGKSERIVADGGIDFVIATGRRLTKKSAPPENCRPFDPERLAAALAALFNGPNEARSTPQSPLKVSSTGDLIS